MTSSQTWAGCFVALGVAVLLGGTLFLWVWTLGQLRGTADIFVVRSWRLAAFAMPMGLGLLARARWAAVSFATVLGGWGLFTVVFAPQDLKNNVPALVANLLIACFLQTPAL